MAERHPSAEESGQSSDDRAGKQPGDGTREEKEPQQQGYRMSIEKHLAGLWKMLGLGD